MINPRSVLFAVLTCFAMFFSGMGKGVSDTLQFHYSGSSYAAKTNQFFWNPRLSWQNKYEPLILSDGVETRNLKKEAFWGSTTVFVSLTDGWHLYQLIQNFCVLVGAIMFGLFCQNFFFYFQKPPSWWYYLIAFGVMKTCFQFGFWLFYQ